MNDRKLNKLIDGLTGVNSTPRRGAVSSVESAQVIERNETASEDAHEERFCTIASSELLRKIRIIARREGLSIKQVVGAAFEKAVASYESKHGTIDGYRRSDTTDLF